MGCGAFEASRMVSGCLFAVAIVPASVAVVMARGSEMLKMPVWPLVMR